MWQTKWQLICQDCVPVHTYLHHPSFLFTEFKTMSRKCLKEVPFSVFFMSDSFVTFNTICHMDSSISSAVAPGRSIACWTCWSWFQAIRSLRSAVAGAVWPFGALGCRAASRLSAHPESRLRHHVSSSLIMTHLVFLNAQDS